MDEESASKRTSTNPEFELGSKPDPAEFGFDLEGTLSSLVLVRAQVPDEALTAAVLGTERGGHGIVISDQGVVVTVGYLVTEAQEIWLTNGAAETNFPSARKPGGVEVISGWALPTCTPALSRGRLSAVPARA